MYDFNPYFVGYFIVTILNYINFYKGKLISILILLDILLLPQNLSIWVDDTHVISILILLDILLLLFLLKLCRTCCRHFNPYFVGYFIVTRVCSGHMCYFIQFQSLFCWIFYCYRNKITSRHYS